ncbi:MAG: hypothetical protein F6K30_20065 [Cyanothece sp. SIO2G6]|nr:hypothetical protein [Cyanothece sp. SIO2G6]
MSKNIAKTLRLFATIQDDLHNGVIEKHLTRILEYTNDKEMVDVCHRAATCINIELQAQFNFYSNRRLRDSVKALAKHLGGMTCKFTEAIQLRANEPQCTEWTQSIFEATEYQLISLSNYFALLDKVPTQVDANGEPVKIGDLVAYPCQDDRGRTYDHYGVVIASPQGFRVVHYFSGPTIQAANTLLKQGFGYVHEVAYSPEWLVKEHLASDIPFNQVEERIKVSRDQEKRVWKLFSYNCEHWAREMVSGIPRCTQNPRSRANLEPV